MRNKIVYRISGFLYSILSLSIGIYGLYLLNIKPDLPISCIEKNNFIEIRNDNGNNILNGSILRSINGIQVTYGVIILELLSNEDSVTGYTALLISGIVIGLLVMAAILTYKAGGETINQGLNRGTQ